MLFENFLKNQSSTQYSPYYLLFHRHPRLPEMMNACPMGETFEVEDPEDELDQRLKDIKAINKKVRSWEVGNVVEDTRNCTCCSILYIYLSNDLLGS